MKTSLRAKTLVFAKVSPLAFTPDTQAYYGIGSLIGQAFSAGRGV